MIFEEAKAKIKEDIISAAALYDEFFLNYVYLLCSPAFHIRPYYVVEADEKNFKHLVGVHTALSTSEFYLKAHDGSLSEDDFDFTREWYTEKDALKCVRNKMKVFPDICNIFTNGTMVEECFIKNRIRCSFAAGQTTCTLGFTYSEPARPMTLLNWNKLNPEKSAPLELVLRKPKASDLFDDIVLGDEEMLSKYYSDIKPLLSPDIRSTM